MRDGVDLSEGQESNLVVSVVRGTTETQECGQRFVGEVTGGNGGLEGSEESSSFNSQHSRDQDESRHGGQDGVKVLRIEVLTDGLSGHGLLGKNTTGRRGNVGKHGRSEGKDGEGKFLHGGNGNSSNDGKKCQVHRKRKNLSQEEVVHQTGNNGFRGLDNVGEGNGSSSEGNDGTDMDTSVAKGDGEKSLHLREIQLGGLAESKKPHGDEVEDTGGHLEGSNSPWVLEDIKGLLIVDIVSNVEKVPKGKVGTDLECFSETGFSIGFGGSLGSGKFDSSLRGNTPKTSITNKK